MLPRFAEEMTKYPGLRMTSADPLAWQPRHAEPAKMEKSGRRLLPPESSIFRTFDVGCRGSRLTTPERAPAPYRSESPPRTTSISLIASFGIRSHCTQSPKASFMGTPSYKTTARLAPLAPTPRNETPCAVGLAVRESVRRNSEKPMA